MQTDRVFVRRVESRDRKQIVQRAKESISFHTPWVSTPTTNHIFRLYMRRIRRTDHEGFVCCLRDSEQIVGVFNLNNILKNVYMSASIGYYAFSEFSGNGFMTEGLNLVKRIAFENMSLHRLEAAIQPDNLPSKALAKRCGFEYEGIAKEYLFLNGRWCDHERWVALDSRAHSLLLGTESYGI